MNLKKRVSDLKKCGGGRVKDATSQPASGQTKGVYNLLFLL